MVKLKCELFRPDTREGPESDGHKITEHYLYNVWIDDLAVFLNIFCKQSMFAQLNFENSAKGKYANQG